jgi:hypothetical protein
MIVKDPEKKACGFISVTRITARDVSALPGPPAGVAIVYTSGSPRSHGWPAHAVAPFRLPRCKEGVGSVTAGR